MVTPSNIRVLSFMSAQQCKPYNKYLVAPSIVKKKLTSIHQTLTLTSLERERERERVYFTNKPYLEMACSCGT